MKRVLLLFIIATTILGSEEFESDYDLMKRAATADPVTVSGDHAFRHFELSSDQSRLVAYDHQLEKVFVYSLDDGSVVQECESGILSRAAQFQVFDQDRLLINDQNGIMRMWDIGTGENVWSVTEPENVTDHMRGYITKVTSDKHLFSFVSSFNHKAKTWTNAMRRRNFEDGSLILEEPDKKIYVSSPSCVTEVTEGDRRRLFVVADEHFLYKYDSQKPGCLLKIDTGAEINSLYALPTGDVACCCFAGAQYVSVYSGVTGEILCKSNNYPYLQKIYFDDWGVVDYGEGSSIKVCVTLQEDGPSLFRFEKISSSEHDEKLRTRQISNGDTLHVDRKGLFEIFNLKNNRCIQRDLLFRDPNRIVNHQGIFVLPDDRVVFVDYGFCKVYPTKSHYQKLRKQKRTALAAIAQAGIAQKAKEDAGQEEEDEQGS